MVTSERLLPTFESTAASCFTSRQRRPWSEYHRQRKPALCGLLSAKPVPRTLSTVSASPPACLGMTRSRSGAAWNGVIAWGWTVACGLPLARGVLVGFGVPGGRREPPPTDGAVEAGGWSPELVGCPGVVGRPRIAGNAAGVT